MRILHNAHIHTMNPSQPQVEALAIQDGKIFAAGSARDVLALARPGDAIDDLNGQTIWPGLTDSHMHLNYYANSLQLVDCETTTKAECLRRLAERAATLQPGEWLLGHGWNKNAWDNLFPTAAELDAIAPNNPTFLTDKSWHSAWVNSAALRLAHITAETPDPDGGRIGRNADGAPDGMLFESATGLLDSCRVAPNAAQVADAIRKAQPILWKMGLTGLHDYDDVTCFIALQELDKAGELKLRVHKGVPHSALRSTIEAGLRSGFGSEYLRIGSLKLFADGALGPQTAAMLQPYNGSADNTGILLLDSEQMYEIGVQAVSNGLSIAIHAIGDRANHEMLAGYAQLRKFEQEHRLPHFRHRIEHVQVLHPNDLGSLADLDIIASVQPLHATSDMFTADHFWGERSAGAYAFQELIQRGTHMAFGSDAPVETPNPFTGIHAAVTRQRPDGSPDPKGWYPDQRLSLAQALAGYTTGAAYAACQENRLGQLSAGFVADLIVLPMEPAEIPPQELCALAPSRTMVGGDWVWQNA